MNSLVYILSPSYSGSTLLTCLLATHREIATVGELKATPLGNVADYSCSCGVPILACPFWESVGKSMSTRGHAFSAAVIDSHFRSSSWLVDRILHAGLRGPWFEAIRRAAIWILPPVRRRYRGVLERNLALIDSITEISGGRVFLDGSKDAIRLQYLRGAGFHDVKVLYLLRDGRGAAYSYMRHHDVAMERAAGEWVRAQRECDRAVRTFPAAACLRMRYEDLCREPAGTMDALYLFLRLDPQLGSLAYRAPEHHILGNSTRLRSTSVLRLDERWREGVTPADRAVFERIAGRLNRSYGYGSP